LRVQGDSAERPHRPATDRPELEPVQPAAVFHLVIESSAELDVEQHVVLGQHIVPEQLAPAGLLLVLLVLLRPLRHASFWVLVSHALSDRLNAARPDAFPNEGVGSCAFRQRLLRRSFVVAGHFPAGCGGSSASVVSSTPDNRTPKPP